MTQGENYRFKLGALSCVAVLDSMGLGGDATSFFANAPAEERARVCRAHGVDDKVTLDLTCLFVDTGSQRILVDTGAGANEDPALGRLQDGLKAESIAAESIDTIILTHWHWDHVWGNTRPDGSLAFPNARYIMWQAEWEWATAEASLQAMQDVGGERSRANLLAIQDRVRLVDHEMDVLPGVRAIPAPGHTVGHMAVLFSSAGGQLLCIGDSVHHPIQVEHPEWHTDFDFAAEQTVETRRALFARAAEAHMRVFSPHLPPKGVGYITGEGAGWRWQPAA